MEDVLKVGDKIRVLNWEETFIGHRSEAAFRIYDVVKIYDMYDAEHDVERRYELDDGWLMDLSWIKAGYVEVL